MKKGWPVKSIGELCILRPPKAEARSRLKDESYVSFLPMENMGIDLKYPIPSKERMLREVDGSYTYFADGDVLLAKITPCFQNGKLGIAKDLRNGTGFGSSEFFVLRPNPVLNSEYLYYFLSRSIFREEGVLCMGGSVGHQRVPPDFLLSQQIILPSLPEQQRIVGVLDEAFACLATAQANAEKNLQNARALFESHLQSVFTHRGKGWEQKRIPDVCITFGRGKSRHRPRNEPSLYGGDYPFIQTGDLSNADHVITTYTQTYSAKGLAQSKLWPKGTVGIAIVGATIGETGILGFDGCFPDSIIGMNVDPKKADPFFIEYMLQHFKETVKSQGEGSARENINLATFDRLVFPIPPIVDQHLIVKKFDLIKKETQRLESLYQQKQAALSALKKSLLHQAFSGGL